MERDVVGAAWRQRWLILGLFLAIVVGTWAISKALPKVYASTGTLIAVAGQEQTFDTIQAGQALARSYADVIDSPIIAQLVGRRLGMRPSDVREATEFESLPETQLLKVTAESRDPEDAHLLAETYMSVFVDYARRSLSPSTGSRVVRAVPADVPTGAIRPRPTVNVVLAALLGLPLALGVGVLREGIRERLAGRGGGASGASELPPDWTRDAVEPRSTTGSRSGARPAE